MFRKFTPLFRNRLVLGSLALGLSTSIYRKTCQETTKDTYLYDKSAYENLDNKELTYKLKTRKEHLNEIKKTEYDVIIIGGGCTGAGIALECVQRGLRCVLLESDDFSQGASSKSTKLVHGGIRYLQQVFEFSLEGGRISKLKLLISALRERSTFLSISQVHTKELPILIPCDNLFWAFYYYAGTMLYHLIYKVYSEANSFQFSAPRIVSKDEIQLYYKNARCKWGVLYTDGVFNDSRMVQEILLTSSLDNYSKRQSSYSNILNYADVSDLIKNKEGQIAGVQFVDKTTNEKVQVRGSIVVNATGCFADSIRLLDNPQAAKRIIPAGGSHIVLPQQYGSKKWGYLIPKTADGRVLFILPWLNSTVVGTTDKMIQEPVKNPTVSDEEQVWLVTQFAEQFAHMKASEITKNIKSKWCGLRPLVLENPPADGQQVVTKHISRAHVIEISPSGLVSVMGGKWTVYREMAEQTVDKIFNLLVEKGSDKKPRISISKYTKLLGEFNRESKQVAQNRKQYIARYAKILADTYKIPIKDAKYFIKTYGDRSFDIFKLAQTNPNYREKIHPQLPHTVGEIVYLIRYEMAEKPQDMIFRRTRLGFIDAQIIYDIYGKLSDIYAEEQKWSNEKKKKYLQENLDHIRSLHF